MRLLRPAGAVLACAVALTGAAHLTQASSPAAADPSSAHRVTLDGTSPDWVLSSAPAAAHGPASAQVLLSAGATGAEIREVVDWLEGASLTVGEVRESILTVPVSGARSDLASAFGTEFVQQEIAGRVAVVPATDLSLPAELTAVETIAGLVDVDAAMPSTTAGTPIESDECAAHWGERVAAGWPESVPVEHRSNSLCGYGPAQLRAVHELPADARGAGATIAVVAAFDDPSVEENTNTYFTEAGAQPFRPGQYTHHAPESPDESRCGGPGEWTVEQHLDVQAAHAIAPDADIVYWGADDCLAESLYLRVLDAVEADPTPDVISLSFGGPEKLDTDGDRALLSRVLVEAASRGVSVFASTGNDGDFSLHGDHPEGPEVATPASNPYLTAVGGTSTGLDAADEVAVEAGWAIQARFAENGAIIPPGFTHGAGGGESHYYARPTWQHDLDAEGTGRLLPDVASLADPHTGFTVHAPVDGSVVHVTHGGTSLATPMVAATVAVAKARTGVEVGLAAPSLYALAGSGAIRDVEPASAATWHRRSPSSGQLWLETLHVWDAGPQSLRSGPGWDPVTGLGVPAGALFLDTFGADR